MQSKDSRAEAIEASALVWWPSPFALLVYAILPAVGIGAELLTGALSQILTLFPNWGYAVAAGLAVAVNLALHLGVLRTVDGLPWRAVLVGFVGGMAALYALVEAPALPLMVVLAIFVLGLLAAAPYFVCLGMFRLVADLVRCWRVARRPAWLLAVLVGVPFVLPLAVAVADGPRRTAAVGSLVDLAEAMRRPTGTDFGALAARVRATDIEEQRRACAYGVEPEEDRDRGGLFGIDGDRRSFWFLRLWRARPISAADASVAFHRAHGVGWEEGWRGDPRNVWDGSGYVEWQRSTMHVRVEPDAALAHVDWLLEVASHNAVNSEARFELRLPVGAVASSLSLWIDGEERPAAFAGRGTVERAYQAVVSKARDPALLQEIGPDRLQLLLFPVSQRLPPMKVRLGFTVPLRLRATDAQLLLPRVVAHTCAWGVPASHALRIEGDGEPRDSVLGEAEFGQPIPVRRGANSACAKDADGFVVQRLTARPEVLVREPIVLVLDASASVAQVFTDHAAMLAALPPGQPCVVLLAKGEGLLRHEGTTDGAELAQWLREQPFAGGVDARPALTAALAEAAKRGVGRVYWLHGAAAELHRQGWPTFTDVTVVALALHPGVNVLHDASPLRGHVVDVERVGDRPAQLVEAFAAFLRFGAPAEAGDAGPFPRTFERGNAAPADAVLVSDQLARLWAARTARASVRAGQPDPAVALAARYRLVTAGVGAVVLESQSQYDAFGLDPGAAIGREPARPIGSGPVPEPGTLLLFASGLLVMAWRWRRQGRA